MAAEVLAQIYVLHVFPLEGNVYYGLTMASQPSRMGISYAIRSPAKNQGQIVDQPNASVNRVVNIASNRNPLKRIPTVFIKCKHEVCL